MAGLIMMLAFGAIVALAIGVSALVLATREIERHVGEGEGDGP